MTLLTSPKTHHLNFSWKCLFICLAAFPLSYSANAATWYLDVTLTSGANNGTSPANAWHSVTDVNAHSFDGGDQILIKRWNGTGTQPAIKLKPATLRGSYRGVLSPQRSTINPTQDITIDAYDDPLNPGGINPLIDAEDQDNTAGILLVNQDHWTIKNMRVTNSATVKGTRWGIFVYFNDHNALHQGINIINNFIYNIYATNAGEGFTVGGINVVIEGGVGSYSRLDQVLIEGNTVQDITGTGIRFKGDQIWEIGANWNWAQGHSWADAANLSTNVVIRRNTITNILNGILVGATKDVLVEYNIVDQAGGTGDNTNTVGGMWPACTEGGLFQYNEVKNTVATGGDREGFNSDFGLKGTVIFQYNYSHNNAGGFFMDCYKEHSNLPDDACGQDVAGAKSVVRYNISQNDGNMGGNLMVLYRGNAEIYNNTIFNDLSTSGSIARAIQSCNPNLRFRNNFRNNIFYATGTSISYRWFPNDNGHVVDNVYENNYYLDAGSTPKDGANELDVTRLVDLVPGLVNPGTGGDGLNTLQGYKLTSTSKCINAGKVIPDNGGRSYWGAGLYNGKPDIGAYEVPNITPILNLLLND